MAYDLLILAHVIGFILIAAGLLGVFLADLRARQVRHLTAFAEAVRTIAVAYDGLVVPGALLVLASGGVMIGQAGYDVLATPWLLGMVTLFAFEFIEGNTVTRLYFLKLRRLTREAQASGGPTPDLIAARGTGFATFTHFLDLPLFLVIVSLGKLRPTTWEPFLIGTAAALAVSAALTILLPRLSPWPELESARKGEM
ncbi:MAG TPA: DUF2269 family protein [Azospirillaceae bacterium]|nr:DUF2269 family protein [Azospirillaceae bacterium]